MLSEISKVSHPQIALKLDHQNIKEKKRVIDNRLGTPSKAGVPPQAKTEFFTQNILDQRDVGYADDNTAPKETRTAIADDHAKIYRSGQNITAKNVFVHGGATLPATMIAQNLHFKAQNKNKNKSNKPLKALSLSPYYGLYLEANEKLGIDNQIIKSKNLNDEKELIDNIASQLAQTDPEQIVSLTIINPNNPTGHIYSRAFMENMLKLAKKHNNLHLIQDTVYDHIIPSKDGHTHNKEMISLFKEAPDDIKERIFEVNSLSKSISYPGLRAGWLIASPKNVDKFADLFDPLYGQMPADTYLAVQSVLGQNMPKSEQMNRKYYNDMNKVYHNKLSFLKEALESISKNGKSVHAPMPDGAFYLWSDFKPLTNNDQNQADKLVKQIIHHAKNKSPSILLKDGSTSGEKGYIRFNASADSSDLKTLGDSLIDIAKTINLNTNESGRTTRLVAEKDIENIAQKNSGKIPRTLSGMRSDIIKSLQNKLLTH